MKVLLVKNYVLNNFFNYKINDKMNRDILIKVLETQNINSSVIKILELLIPTINEALTLDDLTNILSLKCLSYSNDEIEKIIFLLINKNKIVITADVLCEIMKSFKYDDYKMLNKLLPYMDDSVTFTHVRKYIDPYIEEKTLQSIISKFDKNNINIIDLLESIKGSFIEDSVRKNIICKYYINDINPDILSNYFSDYDIYAKICKKADFKKDEYEKYKEKIEEDNKSIIIFDMKHLVNQFTLGEPYTIRNHNKDENITLTITRKTDNNIFIEYSKDYKTGFISSSCSRNVTKGIVINLNGFISEYK